MNIYLDMDGTLMDFWGHATARGVEPLGNEAYLAEPSTWTPDQKRRQDAIDDFMRSEEFWRTIPAFPYAHELIAAASLRATTYILTAQPSIAKDDPALQRMIRRAKIECAMSKLHFPASRVIVCERKDKANYALRRDYARNLLVDDAEQNCDEWRDRCGIAVLHRDYKHSIERITRLSEV